MTGLARRKYRPAPRRDGSPSRVLKPPNTGVQRDDDAEAPLGGNVADPVQVVHRQGRPETCSRADAFILARRRSKIPRWVRIVEPVYLHGRCQIDCPRVAQFSISRSRIPKMQGRSIVTSTHSLGHRTAGCQDDRRGRRDFCPRLVRLPVPVGPP